MSGRRSIRRRAVQDDDSEDDDVRESSSPAPSQGRRASQASRTQSSAAAAAVGAIGFASSDEDEEEGNRASQRSTQRSRKRKRAEVDDGYSSDEGAFRSISNEEKQKLIVDVVRYCIFCDIHKKPIKRDDIVKDIIKGYINKDRHIFNEVITAAKKILLDTFGWELRELPKVEKTGEMKPTKNYGLRLTEELRDFMKDISPSLTVVYAEEQGLLAATLGYIFLCDGVEESALYRFYEEIGLCRGVKHDQLGNWEKYLENFIKQQYIVVQRPEHPDSEKVYQLGPRALVEVGKPFLLEFVAKVSGEPLDNERMAALRGEELEAEANFLIKLGDKAAAELASQQANEILSQLSAGPAANSQQNSSQASVASSRSRRSRRGD